MELYLETHFMENKINKAPQKQSFSNLTEKKVKKMATSISREAHRYKRKKISKIDRRRK